MKPFLTTLFGGLAIVFLGLGTAWGAGQAWRAVYPRFTAAGDKNDATVVSGFLRTIRYSAMDEEDPIDQTGILSGPSAGPVSATAYVIRDLTSGVDKASYSADRLQPVASLTKLVTAAVARDLIPAEARIAISAGVISAYGNTAGFRLGETLTAGDLLYPLLMVSSNETAEAYARYYGRKQFIQAMNDFVQRIGAYRTYFADPAGLSPLSESTASDMAVILDWIRVNDPGILAVTREKAKTIRGHTWVNPTHFLSWSYYEGGKNGYTDEADRTSAGLFALGPGKHTYAVVVLGSENRDADVIKLLNKIE